jgi:GDP-4-dehydro-6-deoxy-D-mannose reductase
MTPTRVLVTGATGLVGRAVLKRLSGGPFETIAVARSGQEGQVKADLADPEGARVAATLQPDAVVHLAGRTSGEERELEQSNVVATGNLLRALAELELRPYVVVAGSAAEYGLPDDGILNEASPLAPLTAYGRVKVAQTLLAQTECARTGIPLTVVRPFNIVSSDLPVSTALGNVRHQLLTQDGSPRKLRCGRLDVVRDYISAAFVADAVARLLELSDPPRILNVCSGVGIELRAIVDAVGEALAAELEIEQDETLTAIPAAPRVIGNPARLAGIGLEYRPTPAGLAAVLLGQ